MKQRGKGERYGGTARADLKDSDFVIAAERKFPVMTAKDVEDAVASWGRYKGDMEFKDFKAKLIALAKRKGFAAALPKFWGVEVKAGRRNSAADYATMKAMYKAMQDYAMSMKAAFNALGITDDDEDEADMEDDEEMTMETKAIDLEQRCAMVCDAISDALEEIHWIADEPDAMAELGDARNAVMAIHDAAMCYGGGGMAMKGDDYEADDDDDEADYEIYVYDDHAILDLGDRVYRVDYRIEDGAVILADPQDWQAVEWETAPSGAPSFVEAETTNLSDNPMKSAPVEVTADANDITEQATETALGTAIKTLAETDESDVVGGYAVLFGDANTTDLSPLRDFFTTKTDFMLDAWATRPMLYHHAMEAATRADPVVGSWTKARIDTIGVWVEGELRKNHQYYAAIKELIKRGALLLSSDSAAHLVERQRLANGAHFVKRWGLIGASLTPVPAEPRMMPVVTLPATKSVDSDELDSAAILELKLAMHALELEALEV